MTSQLEKDRNFLMAVECEDALKVSRALSEGANINARTSTNKTALHKAAFNGDKETLKVLIAENADLNIQCDDGFTAVHSAAIVGKIVCVELLHEAGADLLLKSHSDLLASEVAKKRGSLKAAEKIAKLEATALAKANFDQNKEATVNFSLEKIRQQKMRKSIRGMTKSLRHI